MRIPKVVPIVATALLASPASDARAQCAGFVDVSPMGSSCTSVEWIKNRAITIGCAVPNSYCPNEPVGRLTMALFMHRFGKVMTPLPVAAEQTGTGLDLTSEKFVCQTPDVAATAYSRAFLGDASVSFVANSPGTVAVSLVQSIDGGPFSNLGPTVHVGFDAGTVVSANAISQNATVAANSTYRFAIRVAGFGFTPTLTSWTCNLQSDVVNQNSFP